ncbi:MAG: hypothetical protein ACLPPO_02365, partial [Mycobacterium sp.]
MPLTTTEVPTFFGPSDSPLFGVVHLPVDNQIRGGVLICGSLGKEAMHSVRLHRILADSLARRGFGVLHFDYLGLGDSAYAQVRDDAVANWVASVGHALDYMDWYYPVLVGALDPARSSDRIDERWAQFAIEGRGIRCVSDRPWVTAAETAECAMALVSIGRREQASTLLGWLRQHRCPDGSYTTGVVYPELSTFPPNERSSYTAAAVVLAADALS